MSKKSEKKETGPEQGEIHTIKLGDKLFTMESVTDLGHGILEDIRKVDSVIQQQSLTLSISNLARQKLLADLTAESEKFTPAEDPETTEESSE